MSSFPMLAELPPLLGEGLKLAVGRHFQPGGQYLVVYFCPK